MDGGQGQTGTFFWGGVMALKGLVGDGQVLNGCRHLERILFKIIRGPGWRTLPSHLGQSALMVAQVPEEKREDVTV